MARPDPRVDPTSMPPKEEQEHLVDQVVIQKTMKPKGDDLAGENAAPAAVGPQAVTVLDPRFSELEPLIRANDWKAIADKLGPLDKAGALPPNLGLVAGIAHNELTKEGSDAARDLVTRCIGGVIGLSEENEIVRVLSRRMLRKNPSRLAERPAPPPRTSILIVVIVLVLGGAVGWFAASPTGARFFKAYR
jgi:hypothetical protein